MKNENKFIKEKNKLKMENDARLLVDLIYLNYEYSNDNPINIEHIYNTLHDTINYTKEEKEKIKKHAFITMEYKHRFQRKIYINKEKFTSDLLENFF